MSIDGIHDMYAQQPQYLTVVSNPEVKTFRFVATMIHSQTGEERLADVVVDSDRYIDVVNAIRKTWTRQWLIDDTWIPEDCDEF